MVNPDGLDKYLYVDRSPEWLIRGVNGIALFTWLLVVYGFSGAIIYDPFYTWIVAPMLFVFTAYYVLSYGLALLFYRRLDKRAHEDLVKSYWADGVSPSVDIFLPICGEELSVLENTWRYVSKIEYSNRKVYVLDDSQTDSEAHQKMAQKYGFEYLARPDRGVMKKAGNLKFGFERSNGEYIVIFDADFAPNKSFVKELLPYMSDSRTAIVQSPQYFNPDKSVHNRSQLEYGAGNVQESFYRYIQVARDYFGGAICCGSNAIYRRSALDSIGGPVQIEHSEDAITGFEVTDKGWRVKYIPLILAIGICPSDGQAYFHQQHRWATGSLSLLTSSRFWKTRVPLKTRMCYWVGFLYYISHPFSIVFSFQLFWTIFVYNEYISIENGLLFYPYLLWTLLTTFFFSISKFRWGSFLATFLQTYAYSHAVFSTMLKSAVGWVPTNTKFAGVSKPFKQGVLAVYTYAAVYLLLIALALKYHKLQLFNYNFYSVQFWIIYNVLFTLILLWYMFKTMDELRKSQLSGDKRGKILHFLWQLRTAGLWTLLLACAFMAIVLL